MIKFGENRTKALRVGQLRKMLVEARKRKLSAPEEEVFVAFFFAILMGEISFGATAAGEGGND